MQHGDHDERTAGSAGSERMKLESLSELEELRVADGDADIRGWEVVTTDGRRSGRVTDLIVDRDAMKVRYMVVAADHPGATSGAHHVLVPIGTARLDGARDRVILGRDTDLGTLPAYQSGRLTREHEEAVRGAYRAGAAGSSSGAAGDFYAHEDFDDTRFWGSSRSGDAPNYLTRSEEELSVRTRATESGSVDVRKSVETERVRQAVPLAREEVVVERRPISSDERVGAERARDDEARPR